MKNITEIDGNSFETEVLRADLPVLVDFYAPWCGPCKMLAPILEQLAGDFQGRVKFVKLDVDVAPEVAGRYGITGVPTLVLFRGGQQVHTQVGLVSSSALKSWLEGAAQQTPTT